MKFGLFVVLFLPAVLPGQQPTEPAYRDSIFSPGISEDAPPLDVDGKLSIHARRIVAPRVFLGTLLTAGLKQWENSPGQYGRGWEGYGKRYGTDYARIAIRETLAFGLDSLTHQDPRIFRSSDTETGARLRHALSQVVIARTDSGGHAFAYGNVISAFAAGEAGSLWLPRRSDGRFGDGLVYAGLVLAGDAGRNVFREFWPDIRRKIHHK